MLTAKVYLMRRYFTSLHYDDWRDHNLCWLIKDRDYYLRGIWLRQKCFWSFAKTWRTSFIETRGAFQCGSGPPAIGSSTLPARVRAPGIFADTRARIARARIGCKNS